MRLGVLDVGSNTVHLLVVDAYPGARPLPAFSHKAEIRLADHLENGGRLSAKGEHRLREFVTDALRIAEDKGVEDFVGFATSAIRDAVNGVEVLQRITEQTNARINVLGGEDEARLTFLAARRWFGWSSGRLLVLDIGGGSLEIASGVDEEPDVAVSLPLGAVRLTRDWFRSDPPTGSQRRDLRRHVRAEIARTVGGVMRYGRPDHAVATSKTFRQLARIAGAASSSEGAVRPARPDQCGPGLLGRPAADDDAGRAGQAARRVRRPGPAASGRVHRRRRGDGPVRPGRAGDLPVGAARRRDPAPPRRPGLNQVSQHGHGPGGCTPGPVLVNSPLVLANQC